MDEQDVAEDEDCGWDRLMLTRLSSKRRSSVPDTREERSAEEPRSTTLPRSATALNTVTQDNDPASISASTAGVKKSLSLLLTNSANSTSCESSLNTSVDTPVRSARYRPPGFRSPQADTTPRMQPRTPPRAPSAPSLTPRSSSSVASSLSSRKTIRSMLAGIHPHSSISNFSSKFLVIFKRFLRIFSQFLGFFRNFKDFNSNLVIFKGILRIFSHFSGILVNFYSFLVIFQGISRISTQIWSFSKEF